MKKIYIIFTIYSLLLTSCVLKEKARQYFYNKGLELYQKGDYIGARRNFKKAIKIDPKFAKAYYMVGLCAYNTKNFSDAFKYFSKAVELNPDLLDAQLKLAYIYILAKQPDQAIERLNFILERNPQNMDALFLKAIALVAQEKKEEAVQLLSNILSLNPENLAAYIYLAKIYINEKKIALAENLLKRALRYLPQNLQLNLFIARFYESQARYNEAEKFYKKLFAIAKDKKTRLLLVQFYIKTNQLDKAEQQIRQLLLEEPDNYQNYIMLADVLWKKSKKREAIHFLEEAVDKFQTEPEVYLSLANFYKLNGNEKSYISTLKKCFQRCPEDNQLVLKVHLDLADYYLGHKQYDLVLEEITNALEKDPKNFHARLLNAKYYLATNQANKAIPELRLLIKDNPKFLEAYELLGRAYFLNNQMELAIDILKKGLQISSDDPVLNFLLAKIYFQKQDFEKSQYYLNRVLAINRNDPKALLLLGDIYFAQGNLKEAKKIYLKAISSSSDNEQAYYKLALLEKEQGHFEDAIFYLQNALQINKTFVEAFTELVNLYLSRQRYKQALSESHKFLKMVAGEKQALVLVTLGKIYQQMGDWKKAEESFWEAIYLNPGFPDSYLNLLELYKQKFGDQAAENFEKKLEEKVGNSTHGWLLLASLYEEEGRYKEAIKCYQKILEQKPNHIVAINNLAFIYANYLPTSENLRKARKLIDSVIDQYPKYPQLLDTSAWIFYQSKDYEKALDDLLEATRIDPENPSYHYHLGLVYRALGQNTLAKNEFKKALVYDSFPEKEKVEMFLKELQ